VELNSQGDTDCFTSQPLYADAERQVITLNALGLNAYPSAPPVIASPVVDGEHVVVEWRYQCQ